MSQTSGHIQTTQNQITLIRIKDHRPVTIPGLCLWGRCGAAEEPLSQQGVRRRRRRRRRSNRTPTHRAAPGRSERSGARQQQHGAAERRAESHRGQQLRSGGAEAEAPVLSAGLGQFLTRFELLSRRSAALCEDNGVTVKVGEVPTASRRRQPDSGQHEEEQLRETGECQRNRHRAPAARDGPLYDGPQDSAQQHLQPEKVGWIRKFCGKGIFREIWKNRFVVLRGDQLFICEKEVKELGRADEVLDLSDYERCEEIRKNKSRSKKNHSKFRLQRVSTPGNTVPNLVFLAVSPEEKESWINILNVSITRSKNRILDEVTVEDAQLSHLTRDRVKIPHNRRLPTRGHLLAVASTSSSDGMLTLDLIQEEDSGRSPQGAELSPDCPRSKTDGALSARTAEASGKSQSLPREVVVVWEHTDPAQTPPSGKRLTTAEKNRCASMDEILTHSETKAVKNKTTAATHPLACTGTVAPVNQLQELISQKLEKTERLLTEVRAEVDGEAAECGKIKAKESSEGARAEAERLLKEAAAAWSQAREVLEEVKELRALYRQLDSTSSITPSNSSKLNPDRRSPM
ncbi:Pleckstrin homology domain-containing family O member 1 [Larimichthys crocea]|nr:Pleckstrin homology domain-containing family O member 1 [Larimichthys crocea]